MNKQELIDDLEKTMREFFELGTNLKKPLDTRNTAIGIYTGLAVATRKIEKLDEPPKVIVPKFVAEWIEQCKIHTSLIDCLNGEYIDHKTNYARDEFNTWVNDNDNDNDEIVARAWLDGYEVKKTAIYRVKLGNGYFIRFQDDGCLLSPHEIDKIMDFDSMQVAERVANKIGGIVVKVDES